MPDFSAQPEPLVAVRVEHHEDLTVAALTGELDMSNAQDVLDRLIEAAGHDGRLEVDLSGLGFIDSAGIGVLHRLNRHLISGDAAGRPSRLRVIAAADTVAGRTLRLAGMDQVLPLHTDDGAA